MDDLIDMQVLQRANNLHQIILHLHLGESFPSLDKLIEGVVGADLEQDVHVLVVLEDVLELDDVVVVERFVDLNFGDELG